MYQVRPLAQHALSFTHGFTHEVEFAMLEVAKTAMNDASGPASDARGEVVLLDQQRALSGASAFPSYGDPVDASSDDDHMKVLAIQCRSGFDG